MGDIKQIFLSHCVASTGVQAMSLNEKLRAAGYTTFVCTAMSAGQEFRREITANAANCKIMIIFLDDSWAKSKECISEFNCAYACFNKTETPRIIPVVMDGFQWIDPLKFPEAHCITANFYCLQKDKNQSWEQAFVSVMNKVDAIMAELEQTSAVNFSPASNPSNKLFLDFLTCEICQEVFKDPRMLPCSHSFCKHCLIDWKNSNGGGTFPCPKCRIPYSGKMDDLVADFRANQLVDAMNNQEVVERTQAANLANEPTGNQADGNASECEFNCEKDLSDWLSKHKMPKEVIDNLLDNGFEFLDIVLEMTDSDIKELNLKSGHERKLSKCIKQHNILTETSFARPSARPPSGIRHVGARAAPISSSETSVVEEPVDILSNWSLIEELYDDRVLSSGTSPVDSLKFWSSLSKIRFENIIDTIKKQAESVVKHEKMAKGIKAKCLQQAATVLSDAGSYAHAVDFAKKALEYEKSPEREFEIKALLAYSTHNKLKEPMWVSETKDPRVYTQLIDLWNDVISHHQYVGKAKLCKVYILKSFTLQALLSRDKSNPDAGEQAEQTLKDAYKLCDELKDDGLKAEAKMTEGLLKAAMKNRPESLVLLLEARKLCLKKYGEFSTLMARIYYNIAIDFEVKRQFNEAYECFRRTWLIDLQIKGVHHPSTAKSGSVLVDQSYPYPRLARTNEESLPGDDQGPNEKDRNYAKRMKFLNDM